MGASARSAVSGEHVTLDSFQIPANGTISQFIEVRCVEVVLCVWLIVTVERNCPGYLATEDIALNPLILVTGKTRSRLAGKGGVEVISVVGAIIMFQGNCARDLRGINPAFDTLVRISAATVTIYTKVGCVEVVIHSRVPISVKSYGGNSGLKYRNIGVITTRSDSNRTAAGRTRVAADKEINGPYRLVVTANKNEATQRSWAPVTA
jgi:hypothetical protein